MKHSALAWSFVQQATRQGLSMGIFFAMAYVLEPSDFGTMSILIVWVAVGTLLADAGFGTAVVQRNELTAEHLTSAFAANVIIAIMSYMAIWALAPVISRTYAEPAMADLLRVLALAILLSSAVSIKTNIAQREMRFRQLAIRDSSAVVIGGVAGISCAVAGCGIWSLVVQTLLGAAIAAIVTWQIVSWRPHPQDLSFKAVRDLSGYGSRMLLFGLLKIATQNVDVMLIGYTSGLAMAGLYSLSSKMIVAPMGAVRAALGAYFFPTFSRSHHDINILTKEYERALKLVGYGCIPFLLVFYFAVDQFVAFALPAKWIDTVPVAKALTFVALFQGFMTISGELMKATGRPGILIWWAAGLSVSTAGVIFVGSHWGLWGIATGIAVVHAVGLIVVLSIGVWLTAPTSRAMLFGAALGPVLMFISIVAVGESLMLTEFDGWFGLSVNLILLFALLGLVKAAFQRHVLGWFEHGRTSS